ncbi:hypothetical protein GOBAR_AA11727 [Gossypium barbadense]|uniref:Uncharacterized protein n=1 Tax=Gossypium barbadense TaxID=3634 RepID=A0A2P5XZZ4_GOSBA|nr:hypothetical protein GOBAR_AA11726 [Gossypium barbadense]PPS08915.1 hypothetical protein GOBAR_AA11727 [Gossypium barbadense]
MEPSNIFGGAEECHSSESGWTMYIDANHEAETDDSMASDASSGPSHRLEQEVEGEEEGRHCYSDKKARKSSVGSKQKPGTKKKEDKEEMRRLKTKESSTQSPSGSRKNIWFGKTVPYVLAYDLYNVSYKLLFLLHCLASFHS